MNRSEIRRSARASLASSSPLRVGDSWVDGSTTGGVESTRATAVSLLHCVRCKTTARGRCDEQWVQHARAYGHGALYDERGREVKPGSIGAGTRLRTIGELIEWRWVSKYVVEFRCRTSPYPIPSKTVERFQWLYDLAVTNYPILLRRPPEDGLVRMYDPTDTDWTAIYDNGITKLTITEYPRPPTVVGNVYCHADLERLIEDGTRRSKKH